MARKLCTTCNNRPANSQYNGNCEPCDTEGGWENEHSDRGHNETNTDPNCWLCHPELNRAKDTYVKQERKGHHSPRRPQINHKACSHAQNPKARRECRKAFWAAKAEQAEAPLTAQYTGVVAWDDMRGAGRQGLIHKDLGGGKLQVRTAKGGYVTVAFASLRKA